MMASVLSRANRPRLVVALFCLGVLVMAGFHHGHSAESIDQRAYVQMIKGIVDHGLPYWDNGPYDRFPQLFFYWGIPRDGHIWGQYGLLYPYLVAPFLPLGGLLLVSRVTFALLAPLALVTYLIAKRVVRNEWYAVAAAVLSILSTPNLAKALEITAYPLMTLLATLATYLTLRCVESRAGWRMSLACGVTWAAASAAHAICFPMALGALVVLGIAPNPDTGGRSWRDGLGRFAPAFAGFVGATLPVSYINHLRFGSWNPVSYGPPPHAVEGQAIADQLQYARPAILFAAVVIAALVLTRKRRVWWIGILVAAVVAAAWLEPIRERAIRYSLVALCNLVGPVFVDLPKAYEPTPEGIGIILGTWVVKGILHSTPILVLVPFAFRGAGKRLWPLVALTVPGVALMCALIGRANIPYVEALGWPWVYARYSCAMIPALIVVSLTVVERMELRPLHAAFAAILGIVVAAFLLDASDGPLLERVVVVIVPLVAAGAVLLAALRTLWTPARSRVAAATASLALGMGIAIGVGHDLRANLGAKAACDGNLDRFVQIVPKRFALIGPQKDAFDAFLSTVTTHDVAYAELRRFPIEQHRPLLEYWRAEGRPIFLYYLWGQEPQSPWPDIAFVRTESMAEILRVEFREDQGAKAGR